MSNANENASKCIIYRVVCKWLILPYRKEAQFQHNRTCCHLKKSSKINVLIECEWYEFAQCFSAKFKVLLNYKVQYHKFRMGHLQESSLHGSAPVCNPRWFDVQMMHRPATARRDIVCFMGWRGKPQMITPMFISKLKP